MARHKKPVQQANKVLVVLHGGVEQVIGSNFMDKFKTHRILHSRFSFFWQGGKCYWESSLFKCMHYKISISNQKLDSYLVLWHEVKMGKTFQKMHFFIQKQPLIFFTEPRIILCDFSNIYKISRIYMPKCMCLVMVCDIKRTAILWF